MAQDTTAKSASLVTSTASGLSCIFCFESLEKENDRNLVDGRGVFIVLHELNDLPFVVRQESRYICKQCLGLLKRRNAQRKKMEEFDETSFMKYKQHCAKRGLAVKTKSQAKRSLPFADNTDTNSGAVTPVVLCTPSSNLSVTLTPSYQSLASASLSTSSSFGSRLSIQSPLGPGLLQSPQGQAQPLLSGGLGSRLSIQSPFQSSEVKLLETTVASGGSNKGTSRNVSVLQAETKTRSVSTQTLSRKRPEAQYDEKGKRITPVYVRAEWESGEREKQLPQNMCSLGKMLVRGTFKQIASAAWVCADLRPHLVKELLKTVHTECAFLCSRKEPSILRRTSKADILDFSFENLGNELQKRVPLFFSVLRAASLKKAAKESDFSWLPPVCMAAAVLLKNRSGYMTSVQLLVSIILQHCGLTVSMQLLLFPSALIAKDKIYFVKVTFDFLRSSEILLSKVVFTMCES